MLELEQKLEEVEQENVLLRNELEVVKNKLELIDRNSRRSNVIFSGIKGDSIQAAKTKIIELCKKRLYVDVNINKVVMLKRNHVFLVELDTIINQAYNILKNSSKLKNSNM